MAKSKRMTIREKKERAEIRAQLRDEGILPPVKKRLNRKKYAEQIKYRFYGEGAELGSLEDILYIFKAYGYMEPFITNSVTPEQIGMFKLLHIAMEIKKYEKELSDQGQSTYDVMDLYNDVVKPIIDL